MVAGIFFALAACGLWALAFVSPIVLEGFSPFLVAFGRYGAFGLISFALAPFFWGRVCGLSRADWGAAAVLSSIGNVVYYVLLASAIQLIDVPGPTVIIGLLLITIPLFANWRQRALPWRALVMPLVTIGLGLLLVNAHEYQRLVSGQGLAVYAVGLGLAVAALACWTWYGIANALWLQPRPHITAAAWTIAQGIAILPVVVAGLAAWMYWNSIGTFGSAMADPTKAGTLGRFLLVSLVVGLGSSWLATLCWSHASRLLLTALAGQLIVFETVTAVAYGYVYRGRWPSLAISLGVVLLCVGVALGVRAVQRRGTYGLQPGPPSGWRLG
jgi:drug/metabolite transporter (DMT)-like permease